MAQTHLQEVLKATGLPEDKIKGLIDLPEDSPDFKTDEYVTPIHTTIEAKVKNDPKFYEGLNRENLPKEFVQKLESEQYGRSANIVRTNMLKAVGLTDKDFADLGEDGKKIDVFTPAFVKKLSEGKVGDKELQAKLIEANLKIAEMETNLPAIEAKYKTESDAKLTDYQFASGVLSELASAPGLKVQPKSVMSDVTKQLKAKYGFEISEGTVELRQKDKPTLKVLTDNGTKELTFKDAIAQILQADGLVDKKAITQTTQTLQVNTGEGGLKMHAKTNDKVANRIAQDAKAG